MLTVQTKTALNAAIAAEEPRRLAAEFLAHCIITSPDDYPDDMLEAARIVLAPVALKGVGQRAEAAADYAERVARGEGAPL